MTPERWQRIKTVLESALELEPTERSAYLDQACAADQNLRRDVESFIAAKEKPGSGFMETPAISLTGLAKGEKLGSYEIVELLGAGGMGEVYRAHDERLDRDVALKVLPAGMLSHEEARRRFRVEALALGRLSHPNIETVHEFNTQDGIDFLVMECIPGVTLTEKVAARPLPENEAAKVGVQLARGLAAAHAHGVLHCDLTPANLRITPDGQLKILDFGLANLFEASEAADVNQPRTQTEAIAGTLAYMAPEQLRGGSADTRTDIYAAGAVLYETVTGQRLFPKTEGPHVIDAILHEDPSPPSAIIPGVSPQFEAIILRALEKEPGRRYQSAGELLADLEGLGAPAAPPLQWMRRWWVIAALGLTVVTALVVGEYRWLSQRKARGLSERDTVVLADFENKTGDRVFDDTLKEALSVSLRQSPFLNILSDEKVGETLKMMTKSADTRLTREVVREVCERGESKGYIAGSIASLGNHYVIGLHATNCATGDTLAQEQVEAASKEDVLGAIGTAAARLRGELGESLARVKEFDVPLEQATTPSLEALQAFTLGRKAQFEKGDYAAAISYYQRAISLDPGFAMAYAALGNGYFNVGETAPAAEYTTKAYELRDRASGHEKLYISSHYYQLVTGDLEKAAQAYQIWAETYPQDDLPVGNLGLIYSNLGQYDTFLAQARAAALRSHGLNYANLLSAYLDLNRLDEAKAAVAEAGLHHLDLPSNHTNLYLVAFLEHDAAGMAREAAQAMNVPAVEDIMLYLESSTAAYSGQLEKARELSQQAAASAERADEKETAAGYVADAALREALFGDGVGARQRASKALATSKGRDVRATAALAYALSGDAAHAQSLANELAKRFPEDTVVQFNYLPTIRAQVALDHNDSAKAIGILKAAAPYELGSPSLIVLLNLYPVYVRGEAYLASRNGSAAAAEFQKILSYPGVIANESIGALAHVGLARAYTLEAQSAEGPDTDAARTKARAAYRDFFALWKDADPDIPILQRAKYDYSKLK